MMLGKEFVSEIERHLKDWEFLIALENKHVAYILHSLDNFKCKIMQMYSCCASFQVAETLALQLKDARGKRVLNYIKRKKGKFAFHSEETLNILRQYWNKFKTQITMGTVQKIFEYAHKASGIKKDASPHRLNQGYKTYLLEYGTKYRHIQELLSHGNNITKIYFYGSTNSLAQAKSPFDSLNPNRKEAINEEIR